jgi:hypothetical protein
VKAERGKYDSGSTQCNYHTRSPSDVSADKQLIRAAQAEGFTTDDPLLHP